MPNRLADETSPYLLQHANNPVDWYPWGEEALERAKAEDKPILLSIGYSACHWCHVMERESFENEEIAAIMNEHFVSIKVDREERPDLDSIYMAAVQALTGSGGWPMTVFLTPDGKPFYGGTYFPPDEFRGMPSFPRVLMSMNEVYRNRKGDVVRATQELLSHLNEALRATRSIDPLTPDILHQAFQSLTQSYDYQNGGFGGAPKFPQPMTYEFLLRYHQLSGRPAALEMVENTLTKMATGGIYDQIGGGFHRYTTDAIWLVPHFEKMLYDNALLSRLYLHTYQATGNPFYRRIVEETLEYILREMTDRSSGFYSAQDADSEGEEGKFFVWTAEEIEEVLGSNKAGLVAGYLGVTKSGNFEGKNILNLPEGAESYAAEAGVSVEELEAAVQDAKVRLLEVRDRRVRPARDEKILSAWNGLMLKSFAEAAAVLHRDDFAQVAGACASLILTDMRQDGRLLRTYKDGRARLKGYLEDYAFVVDGLLSLYEATFDNRWFGEAKALADDMVDLFWDKDQGVFFDTGRDHETLVVCPRDFFDNATPCGSSVAVDVLLRLAVFTGNGEYNRLASGLLRSVQQFMARAPMGMGHWLCALDFYLSTPREIAIVGPIDDDGTQGLLRAVHGPFLPNKVVAGYDPGVPGSAPGDSPLLEDKDMIGGRPTAYVCQNYACQLPVTEPEDLAHQLVS